MIDQFLEGWAIGMALTARKTWWLFPAVELFEKLRSAVRDILSGEDTNNTDEKSI